MLHLNLINLSSGKQTETLGGCKEATSKQEGNIVKYVGKSIIKLQMEIELKQTRVLI
jgi:hypothetical protein